MQATDLEQKISDAKHDQIISLIKDLNGRHGIKYKEKPKTGYVPKGPLPIEQVIAANGGNGIILKGFEDLE